MLNTDGENTMIRRKKKNRIMIIFKDELEKKVFYKIAKIYDDPVLSDEQKRESCEEMKKLWQ